MERPSNMCCSRENAQQTLQSLTFSCVFSEWIQRVLVCLENLHINTFQNLSAAITTTRTKKTKKKRRMSIIWRKEFLAKDSKNTAKLCNKNGSVLTQIRMYESINKDQPNKGCTHYHSTSISVVVMAEPLWQTVRNEFHNLPIGQGWQQVNGMQRCPQLLSKFVQIRHVWQGWKTGHQFRMQFLEVSVFKHIREIWQRGKVHEIWNIPRGVNGKGQEQQKAYQMPAAKK